MKREKLERVEESAAPKGEEVLFKFTHLGYRGDISGLDEEGRSLLWRAGDLRARVMLNDMSMAEYNAANFEGCCTLIHAERYLSDRLAYELNPWPKGKVKNETINPLPSRCPHCDRIIIVPDLCGICKKSFCGLNCTLDHKHFKEIANAKS